MHAVKHLLANLTDDSSKMQCPIVDLLSEQACSLGHLTPESHQFNTEQELFTPSHIYHVRPFRFVAWPSAFQQEFMVIRNAIIEAYKANPGNTLSLDQLESLPGTAEQKGSIWTFLDEWGVINFQAYKELNFKSRRKTDQATSNPDVDNASGKIFILQIRWIHQVTCICILVKIADKASQEVSAM